MKLNKSNFSLLLMVNNNLNYEGTINVIYNDRVFQKDVEINDSSNISENNHPLTDSEKVTCNQINKLISREFDKKGFRLDKWNLYYESNSGEINIQFKVGEDSINAIQISMIENNMIAKKSLTLSRSLSKRLLKELT